MKPSQAGGFILANLLFAALIGYVVGTWLHNIAVAMIACLLYAIIGSFVIIIYRMKHPSGSDGKSK